MKILIIGYGSIGKRHEEVLLELENIEQIDIVTNQYLSNKRTFKNLEDIQNLNDYDYFIIASETNKHYTQLKYLESMLTDKIIFCEKPLFESQKILKITKIR